MAGPAEPLVVEPRFREQFMLAHATPVFDNLLLVRGRVSIGWGCAPAATAQGAVGGACAQPVSVLRCSACMRGRTCM